MKKSTKNSIYFVVFIGVILGTGFSMQLGDEQFNRLDYRVNQAVGEKWVSFYTNPTIGLRYEFDYDIPSGFNLNSVKWDFGDGSPEVKDIYDNPMHHTFPNSGTFEVKLTVTFEGDTEEYQTKNTISVEENPGINFEVHNSGENIYYFISDIPYTENVEYFKWEFGDGSIVEMDWTSPIYHTYAGDGIYSVVLTVKYMGDPEFHTVTQEVTIGGSSSNGVIDPNDIGNPLSFIPGYPPGLLFLMVVSVISLIFNRILKRK